MGEPNHGPRAVGAPGRLKVLSVNLAVPRTVEVKGQQVRTGIYKVPVPGPHRIESLGLVGDFRVEPRKFGEANHAVYIYPHEHYPFWEGQLGREPFPHGQFGENLTTAGLTESDVRVGDLLRCGTALLRVTQPRIPCRKLNARMGLRFAGTFLRSRRVGFYLRVLEPGGVAAGDEAVIVESDPTAPTIDDFVRISQLDYWDAVGLESLLSARHLEAAWRTVIEEKLTRARQAVGWIGLREMEVVRRVEECEGVASFDLRCTLGRPLFPFRPGQFLTVAVRPTPVSNEALRPYAISSSPLDLSSYRITVELRKAADATLPEGMVSSILYRDLRPGDRLRVAAPRGSFCLDEVPATCPGLLFLADGIGMAPVVSMLHYWADTMSHLPAALACSAASGSCLPLWRDVEEIARRRPALRLLRAVRRAREGGAPETKGIPGHGLTAADLKPLAPGPDGLVFISGPATFVNQMVEELAVAGATEAQLRLERFGA